MIIEEFRALWQRSLQDRWQEPGDQSRSGYLRWWLEHNGDSPTDDTIGCRVERKLRAVRRAPWIFLRANRDLCTFYDRTLLQFGPIVAAEALRRLLLAMAHGPLPCTYDHGAEAIIDDMIKEADQAPHR